jgi:hypothetical protein
MPKFWTVCGIGLQIRHKARLVRRNQPAKSMIGDTYAATPAVRYFSRVFMTTAAPFYLELIQYDAVNAFVHAKLVTRRESLL